MNSVLYTAFSLRPFVRPKLHMWANEEDLEGEGGGGIGGGGRGVGGGGGGRGGGRGGR